MEILQQLDVNNLLTLIITILTTISTLLVSQHYGTKNLKNQLLHNEKLQIQEYGQRDKARLFELRHDVYLDATAEMQKAFATLASIPGKDITPEVCAEFTSYFTSMAKAKLVAGPETGTAIQACLDEFGPLYMWTLNESSKLHSIRNEIDDLESELSKHYDYASYNEILASQGPKIAELQNRQMELNQIIFTELTRRYEHVLPHVTKAQHAVKIELGIESDLIKLMAENEYSKNTAIASIKESLNSR